MNNIKNIKVQFINEDSKRSVSLKHFAEANKDTIGETNSLTDKELIERDELLKTSLKF